MPCWSAENATKAYLTTLKMGERAKEPDVAEFISALAAGNNAQLMVLACAGAADSTVQALVAAGHQTGGRVICIVRTLQDLTASKKALGFVDGPQAQFIIGEAQELLMAQYDAADFVLVDCNLHNHDDILRVVHSKRRQNGRTVVVGYNAFNSRGSRCMSCGSKTQFLPIGEGLLVTKFGGNYGNVKKNIIGNNDNNNNSSNECGIMGKLKRSRWIVKVDKCTGEEHVFRVRFPQGKVIQA